MGQMVKSPQGSLRCNLLKQSLLTYVTTLVRIAQEFRSFHFRAAQEQMPAAQLAGQGNGIAYFALRVDR